MWPRGSSPRLQGGFLCTVRDRQYPAVIFPGTAKGLLIFQLRLRAHQHISFGDRAGTGHAQLNSRGRSRHGVQPYSPSPLLFAEDLVQMPPTPPSSHGSDSDGSQSPRSLPPSSPVRPMARSSMAISTSPLLTAPHVSSWGWVGPGGEVMNGFTQCPHQ